MDERALVKLNEKHERLVKSLKNALRLGQLGFLHAGKFLYEIWSGKTFLSEDSSREITFTEFCTRPDLPIPGSTDASRLRTAQKLIRVWKFYIIDKKFPESKLIPVGYTKLNLLAPVIEKREKEANEWLKKATILTLADLIMEIKQKDKSFEEILECDHKGSIEEVTFFRCTKCQTTWKNDPRKKK